MTRYVVPLFFVTIFLWSLTVQSEILPPKELTIKTINGKSFKLSDFIGKKPVYLKFWASWCQPCREQMPHLQHTFNEYGKTIKVIAINLGINDNVDSVVKTKKEFSLTVPITIDQNASLSQAYHLRATPYHVLLDKNGQVVYSGHDVSDKLNKALKSLASNTVKELPRVKLTSDNNRLSGLVDKGKNPTILFFSSAWCDWYLEKSRPKMSSNCINAQQLVSQLHKKYPQLNWQGVLSRLWTGDKELAKYREKYNIRYQLRVDQSNHTFFNHQITNFPTLVALVDGKEIFRIQNFSDRVLISNMFSRFK